MCRSVVGYVGGDISPLISRLRASFPPRGSLREKPFTLHDRVKKWQIKPLFSAKSCICVVFAMLALPQIRLPLGREENCKQFVAFSD